ncbi:MAG: hypothetical protein KAY24_16275, partial [Candidatus Eisenbacteria sp.]|nr:hypothetical protein [Candidatus Eisenbacteria bacterium]
MKKIKVTRRVITKPPWYERPPLLFGAIAGLLIISGFVMAQLNSRSAQQPTVLGTGGDDDSLSAPAESLETVGHLPGHVLASDAPWPPAVSGECLPPVEVETLKGAVALRARLRHARALEPLVSPS